MRRIFCIALVFLLPVLLFGGGVGPLLNGGTKISREDSIEVALSAISVPNQETRALSPENRIDRLKSLWRSRLMLPLNTSSSTSHDLTIKELSLKAYKEDNQLIRKQLLQQFTFPLVTQQNQVKWLDNSFVFNLKGAAVLATHPHILRNTSQLLVTKTRGIHLMSTVSLVNSMKYGVVEALSASIGANLAIVNQDALEAVRQAALRDEAIIPKEILTDSTILSSLLDLADEEDSPLVVAFDDDLTWIKENPEVSRLLYNEITDAKSKTLYVIIDQSEKIIEGNAPNTIPHQQSSPGDADQTQSSNLPHNTMPPMMGRSFQVVIKNGSASLHAGPRMFGPMIRPPDAVLKRIMEDQQSKLHPSSPRMPQVHLPPFLTPDMSDEDIQSFISSPENQIAVKAFMDKVIGMVGENMPIDQIPDGMDIKVNIMQIPVPFPFRNPGIPANPVDQSMSPKNATQHKQLSRFPGFLRAKKKSPEDSNEKSSVNDSEEEELDIMPLFEKIYLEPPSEHSLRTLLDSIREDEQLEKIERRNCELLTMALKKANIDHESDALSNLHDVLSANVLSKAEAKTIVADAVKFEAARMSSGTLEQMRISAWALDMAVTALSRKGGGAKRGSWNTQSPGLMKQELNSIVTDKYERGLLGNVMFPQDIGVSYDMIGGLSEVKELLRQSVTYPLKYPRLYREGIARDAVKGVLLFGPPGTGKTMLAKAVATEGGAAFLSIDASSIENKWLGESEKNAKAVFALARRIAPCVVFIDEVDSLLSSREHGDDSSHGTITSVKTTLMQEWDGLRTTKDRVIVIASTNRPFDLDEAVLRRLPRRIMVDLPDLATREDILRVTLANNRLASDVNLTAIAALLDGYSGSDIKEVCREAVVRVSHEMAVQLDRGIKNSMSSEPFNVLEPLRPSRMEDFKEALRKLKASVAETSRELQKVVDWNEKYGELKTSKPKRRAVSLYI